MDSGQVALWRTPGATETDVVVRLTGMAPEAIGAAYVVLTNGPRAPMQHPLLAGIGPGRITAG